MGTRKKQLLGRMAAGSEHQRGLEQSNADMFSDQTYDHLSLLSVT